MPTEYSHAECVSRILRTLPCMKLERSVLSEQIKFILEYAVDFKIVLSYYSSTRDCVVPYMREHSELINKVFPYPSITETLYHVIDEYIQEEYAPISEVDEEAKEALDLWDKHLCVDDYIDEIISKPQAELLVFGCLSYIHSNKSSLTTALYECIKNTLHKLSETGLIEEENLHF